MIPQIFRTLTLILLVAAACPSCMDQERKIVVNPDGKGKFTVTMTADVAAYVRLISVKGAVHIPPEVRQAVSQMLLAQLIAEYEGVDVWSEAKFNVDEKGVTHLSLEGFFKDINAFRMHDHAPSMTSNLPLPQPGAVHGWQSTVDAEGRWILEAKMRPPTVPLAQARAMLPLSPAPEVTSEQEMAVKVREEQGHFSMLMSMVGRVQARRMTLSDTVQVGGSVLESKGLLRVTPSAAMMSFSYEKLIPLMEERIKDGKFVQNSISTYGNFYDGMYVAALSDAQLAEKIATILRGTAERPKLICKRGENAFDYEKEASAAKAMQTAELQEILRQSAEMKKAIEKARSQRGGGGKGKS
jgi:hypothetical protein